MLQCSSTFAYLMVRARKVIAINLRRVSLIAKVGRLIIRCVRVLVLEEMTLQFFCVEPDGIIDRGDGGRWWVIGSEAV